MNTNLFTPLDSSRKTTTSADELNTIRELFNLPELSYVDIATEAAVMKIIHTWPLLLELSQLETQPENLNDSVAKLVSNDSSGIQEA